jgi:hypothetical protein
LKKLRIYKNGEGQFSFYNGENCSPIDIEYDENGQCKICGLPVYEASFGGIDVCPWCDMGLFRNGKKWDVFPNSFNSEKFKNAAKANVE